MQEAKPSYRTEVLAASTHSSEITPQMIAKPHSKPRRCSRRALDITIVKTAKAARNLGNSFTA